MSELHHELVAVDPKPKDYMPIDPDFWHLIKMNEYYETLHTYIDKVTPYDGEVGRYPINGKQEEDEDENADGHLGVDL